MFQNQNNLVCVLGLLLILFVVCKQQNKSVSELFGISGLSFDQKKENNVQVGGSDHTILFFHANWCGHCQGFKPEWSKFEEWCGQNNQKCKSIEGDAHPELCKKYNIEGYPTVLKVNSNGDLVEEFNGPRSVDGLKQFCSQ